MERYSAIAFFGGQSRLVIYIWYDMVFFSDYLDIIIIICFSVSTFGQVFRLLEAGGQSKLAAEDHSAHSESMEKCNCDQDIGDEEVDVDEQNHVHDSDVDIKEARKFDYDKKERQMMFDLVCGEKILLVSTFFYTDVKIFP